MVSKASKLRIAFSGDRDIAVWVLRRILLDIRPLALLIPEKTIASHAGKLIDLCSYLPADNILIGQEFRQPTGVKLLKQLNLDFIIAVHFPYIIPSEVLFIPTQGVLNLHPAFLPYNRGWHTPSWAILENTPIGATLHFIDKGIDTGDIVHQKQISISPGDTAHSLYQRLKKLGLEVFEEAWPQILSGTYTRKPQSSTSGTTHKSKDLFNAKVQRIDLSGEVKASDLLKQLRALTTNQINESAYFDVDGKRYRVQIVIHEE